MAQDERGVSSEGTRRVLAADVGGRRAAAPGDPAGGNRTAAAPGDSEAATGGPRTAALASRLWCRVVASRRVVVVCVCLLVFLVLLNRVLAGEILALDRAAIALMVDHVRAPWLTPIMVAVSALVTAVPLLACIGVVAVLARRRGLVGLGMFCTVNLVGSTLLNQVLKFAIQRPRPDVALRLVEIGGFSFPSGHSMAAMAFFGLFIWVACRYVSHPVARRLLIAALGAMIVAVGFSRVYLGVHYASDVVGGFCASLIWLAAYTKVAGPLVPRAAAARAGATM